jgi:hypothetical protein
MFREANRCSRGPYDESTFAAAAENGNLENMKWLFENKFPYDEHIKKKLINYKLLN